MLKSFNHNKALKQVSTFLVMQGVDLSPYKLSQLSHLSTTFCNY